MSSERSIETTGDNLEEAIAKGLAELGVKASDVIVEVLEEPSRGVFGLGARPARVRLQVINVPKPPPPPPPPEPVAPPPPPPTPVSTVTSEMPAQREQREQREREQRPPREPREQREPRRPQRDAEMEMATEEEDAESLFNTLEEIVAETDMSEDATVGRVVLGTLLEKMDVRSTIVVRRATATKPNENVPYILDVTAGGDLTRLIGKRGDTLAALQYITRLVTSRELQRRANVIVDVDGYKARRANMLKGLALRMADQAIEKDRTVTLEPMPPHERRIIHLALRDREDVETRSVGEGVGRKVTIVPKSQAT